MVKPRRVALRRDTFELWVPRFWKVKPEPRRPAPEFSHKRGAPCKLPDHAPSRSSRRGGPTSPHHDHRIEEGGTPHHVTPSRVRAIGGGGRTGWGFSAPPVIPAERRAGAGRSR